MGKPLKVGIIGAGILGTAHAEALQEEDRAQLVAVADKIIDRAHSLAGRYGANAYEGAQEMVDGEDLDVAVIATPDPFHKDPFTTCAEAGVGVILCEKPLATNIRDAEEMMNLAEKRGVRVFVDFENRFARADMATRYLIQNGLIGEPVYADMQLDDNISVPTMLWGERSRDWAAGTSTAHFLMSHTVDLVRWYFEPAKVEKVFAICQRRVLKYTPDLYEALLLLSNGVKVRLKSEWIRHMDDLVEFSQYVGGSKGGVFYHKRRGFNKSVGWKANLSGDLSLEDLRRVQRKLEDHGIKAAIGLEPDHSRGGEGWRPTMRIEEEGAKNLSGWPYFIDAILEGSDSPERWKEFGTLPTGRDGYESVRVVCAIIASSESCRTISL
ncbi:TPA: Gfo/Idh/MocA family oxidoreductase [Candidatus Poribacteria bacterium]|nr:Gfo/Idh/MocA family oxidoreductase [Candidatus Poribacteria bacterium]